MLSERSEFAGKLLQVITIVYSAVLAILFVAPFFITSIEAKGLIRTGLVLMAFPSLLLFLLLLLDRRWLLAAVMAFPAAGWAASYGPLLSPRGAPAPPDALTMRVMTFNLQAADENLDSIIAIVESADADVVAVQELSGAMADRFEAALGDAYPHQALHPQDNAHVGNGVLSRYPITADNYWRNEQLEATLGHQRVVLDVDGVDVTLYNTHPVPPFSFERRLNFQPHSREIRLLLERARGENGPVILAGDFNMTDQFDEYNWVTRSYVDTFREAGRVGFGLSFPNGQRLPSPPLVRLDYVFHNDDWQGVDAHPLGRSGSSDHLPYVADLALVMP